VPGKDYDLDTKKIQVLERRIDSLRILKKRREDRKTIEGVLDTQTLLHLFQLIKRKYLFELHGVISTGKEANVYQGLDYDKQPIAVKIYRTSTADFKKLKVYIQGDERFKRVRRNTKHLITTWALKEFKNLKLMEAAGVNVPHPIIVRGNVLIMDFIGEGTLPAPLLKDVVVEDPAGLYKELKDTVKLLYSKAGLVHADFSEYNILFWEKPYIIDVSQSVLVSHPMADEFLERDVNNLVRYFRHLGVETDDPENVLEEMKSGSNDEDG
jgi:RIO kinase 1